MTRPHETDSIELAEKQARAEYEAAVSDAKLRLDLRLETLRWARSNGHPDAPTTKSVPIVPASPHRHGSSSVNLSATAAAIVQTMDEPFDVNDVCRAMEAQGIAVNRTAVISAMKRMVASGQIIRVTIGNNRQPGKFKRAPGNASPPGAKRH